MNPRNRLSSRQQQESETTHQEQRQSDLRVFASPEELLRHDAAQTPVPSGVAARLEESLASVPRPREPWWRRWLKP